MYSNISHINIELVNKINLGLLFTFCFISSTIWTLLVRSLMTVTWTIDKFPQEWMTRKVPGCGDKHYSSLSIYIGNTGERAMWGEYMFYCDKCTHREIKKRHIIHHINEKHKGKPSFTHKKSVINLLVDPKDVLSRKKSNSKLIENMLSAYYFRSRHSGYTGFWMVWMKETSINKN